jgi:tetratricopeptide (TPR) repeat protein
MPKRTTFINRVTEIKAFVQAIGQTRDKNTIILLEAPTGYGKSSFTERLLIEQRAAPAIKIRMMAGAAPDGAFMRETARSVDIEASGGAYASLEQYLSSVSPDTEIRRAHHSKLGSKLVSADPSGIAATVTALFDRARKRGLFDADNLMNSWRGEDVSILADYVKQVLRARRLVLNIENIQDTDRVSLSLLRELFAVQNAHFIILEHTTGAAGANTAHDLESLMQDTGSNVHRVPLDKLSVSELVEGASETHQIKSLLKRALVNYDGNLRALLDVEVLLAGDNFPELSSDFPGAFNPTAVRIQRLGKGEAFALACVSAHQGRVREDMLYHLYNRSDFFREVWVDFASVLDKLKDEDMLRSRGAHVVVAHDSIRDAVLGERAMGRYVVVAFEEWSRVYTDLYHRSDFSYVGRDEVLTMLFYFYVRTEPVRLVEVVDEVKELALSSLRPSSSLHTIEKLAEELRHPSRKGSRVYLRVTFELLGLYYLLGLFAEGLHLLEEVDDRVPQRDIYQVAFLTSLDRNEEALELIAEFLRDPITTDEWYPFFLELFRAVALRYQYRMDEARAATKQLLNNRRYTHLPAYALAVRSLEFTSDVAEGIGHLERSIEMFEASGFKPAAAQTRISLGVSCLTKGDLPAAEAQFMLAMEELERRTMKRHFVLNNRAVIRLLSAEPLPDQAIDLLTMAQRTVTVPFDRIVVMNNLLIAQAMRGNHAFVEDLDQTLLPLAESHPVAELSLITAINLAFAWDRLGYPRHAARFRERSMVIGDLGVNYYAHRLHNTPLDDPEEAFLASFPFQVAVLAHWDAELSDFIPVPH